MIIATVDVNCVNLNKNDNLDAIYQLAEKNKIKLVKTDTVDTETRSQSVNAQSSGSAPAHTNSPTAFFNKHKTLTITAASIILLGLPLAFLINTLNRSVEEDARDKPELTEREK